MGGIMNTKAAPHACLHHKFKGHDIDQRHGDIEIRIFRLIYGAGFAPAFCASHLLHQVVAMLDKSSLDKLINDNKSGALAGKIVSALAQQEFPSNASASGR